jgi:antagonist of KipI
MADRQTTGGYPRIGEVASVDLPLIAQLKPADRVRFRFISLDEAQRLYLAVERELAQARHAIRLRLSRGGS